MMNKNKESLTIERVGRLAQEMTMREGSHVPLLIAEGDKDNVLFPIFELASSHEDRVQQMFITGLMLAKSSGIGVLEQVFFVTEAWLSKAENGKIPEVPPSQDPERVELLTISNFNVATKETKMACLEMKRDEHGELNELADWGNLSFPETVNTESTLFAAFVQGFLGIVQEVDD
jgi:hypothetical protein